LLNNSTLILPWLPTDFRQGCMSASTIIRLTIERFRGIEALTWLPAKGTNLILGGGDAGKTTILDAIALLVSPTNTTTLSDADYFGRKLAECFKIEARLCS